MSTLHRILAGSSFVAFASVVAFGEPHVTTVQARPSAQEEEGRPDTADLLQQTDPNEELRRLFREVETTLRRIDDQLFDASAGEVDLDDSAADIDRLLRDTEDSSRRAVEGIDEILRVASEMQQQQQQQQQSGGQSGGDQQSQSEQSPLDDNTPPERQQRMEGEEGADPTTEQQSGQDSERPQGSNPEDDPRASDDAGQNSAGQDPAQANRGPGSSASGADRWGDLPPRVQSIFRNQVNDDLPVQYRDWIDRYHRRLNQ